MKIVVKVTASDVMALSHPGCTLFQVEQYHRRTAQRNGTIIEGQRGGAPWQLSGQFKYTKKTTQARNPTHLQGRAQKKNTSGINQRNRSILSPKGKGERTTELLIPEVLMWNCSTSSLVVLSHSRANTRTLPKPKPATISRQDAHSVVRPRTSESVSRS